MQIKGPNDNKKVYCTYTNQNPVGEKGIRETKS